MTRIVYLIGLIWLFPAYAQETNACREIEFVTCHSVSTDINKDVTIRYPRIFFQGTYRAVAYADPLKYVADKPYDQVAAWSALQKKNLCRLLNLGEPVAFESEEGSIHPALEIQYVDGKVSARPTKETKYLKSITCSAKSDGSSS